jgi:RNA polymerase subunit RPABC4/transcription elongation factor Spt4
MILQENENDESRSENSESNSDKSDTYDLRHTGMCENCHYMGLVGTLCPNCEELQHVLKQPGETVLKELTDQHYAKKFTTEVKLNLMTTNGAGLCAECMGIGPLATICTVCVYKDATLGPQRYEFQEEILQESEGICFNCHKKDLNGKYVLNVQKG